jgi:hypothetical protein
MLSASFLEIVVSYFGSVPAKAKYRSVVPLTSVTV